MGENVLSKKLNQEKEKIFYQHIIFKDLIILALFSLVYFILHLLKCFDSTKLYFWIQAGGKSLKATLEQ